MKAAILSRGDYVASLLILTASFAVTFLTADNAFAMEPPDAAEVAALRSTGQLERRIDFASRTGNHRIDSFLLSRAVAKAKRAYLRMQGMSPSQIESEVEAAAPPPRWQGMPSTGNVKVLAILIEFQDETHIHSQATINSNLFGIGNPLRTPYDSVATYYDRASYGQLDLSNGNTLGWYQTSYNRTAVQQDRTGREALIKEVLDSYDAQGHDFSQYDNDGNGVIDYFIVIWAGPDTGWGSFWWGYQTNFIDSTYQLDGVTLGKYSWQWETRPVGSTYNPVVVIHETGHAIGLPDFYDYDDTIGPQGGVGGLDIMDGNKGDHNCFSKFVLDWLTPTPVPGGTHTLTLNASGDSRDCVMIWPGVTTNDLFSELFIVQNRHRTANDGGFSGMPGDGMLIWHVDATLNSAGTDYQYDNSFAGHKLLRLMEADGLEEIEAGGIADTGDYYTAGDSFGPTTTPASSKYDGTDSQVEVYNFSAPGQQMTATFRIAGAGTGQADYAVTALSIGQSRVAPGGQVQVSYTAANSGANPSAANCIRIGVFLSTDANITPTDTSLSDWQLAGCNLAQNQTVSDTLNVAIPASTVDAVYSIGVLVDVTDVESESNEGNNAKATSLEVRSGDQGVWGQAYIIAAIDNDKLALLRQYRDAVLLNDEKGSAYVRAIYAQSEAILKFLRSNPRLLVRLGGIVRENILAITEVSEGKSTQLRNVDLISGFLDDFAAEASPDLGMLAMRIKQDLLVSQEQGNTFLGFSME